MKNDASDSDLPPPPVLNGKKMSVAQWRGAVELVESGMPISTLEAYLGISRAWLVRYFRRGGIELRGRDGRRVGGLTKKERADLESPSAQRVWKEIRDFMAWRKANHHSFDGTAFLIYHRWKKSRDQVMRVLSFEKLRWKNYYSNFEFGGKRPSGICDTQAVMDLTRRDCRWPVAMNGEDCDVEDLAGWKFCGAAAEVGRPYCEKHSARAFVKKRRAKNE